MFLSGEALEKDIFTMHQAVLIAKTSSYRQCKIHVTGFFWRELNCMVTYVV